MPSKADQKMELQAASGLALGGLMAVEGGLKMMLHPDFAFDAKQAAAQCIFQYQYEKLALTYGK